jgi:hypothetical protein
MQAKVRPYNLWHKIVRIVQYTLSGILLFVFLQMVATSHYSTIMLILVMSISYTLVGIMLGILAQRFFSWYIRHRTLVVLVYGLSAAALAINSGFTLGFVTSTLSKIFEIVGNHTDVFSYIAVPSSLEYLLYSGYTVFSILSFVLTWLATAVLLYPYSKKFGRIKYWAIISLPVGLFS